MKEQRPPGLEVRNYRRGVVEETVGRVGALPANIMLGTPDAILGKVPDIRSYIKEKYKDVKWQGNVEVHLNRSPLFRQMKRLFEKERKANLFARSTLGLSATLSSWVAGKFTRANLYNPFTETVQIFHSNPAIAMHEVGHAVDYDKRERPSLRALARYIPFVANKQEWNASRNAMKHLDPQERDKAKKVLEPAFGSYTGAPLLPFTRLARWVGPAAIAAQIGGIFGGHIHSRISRKNIFYNSKTEEHASREKKILTKKERKDPVPVRKVPVAQEVEQSSEQITTVSPINRNQIPVAEGLGSSETPGQIADRLIDYKTGKVKEQQVDLLDGFKSFVDQVRRKPELVMDTPAIVLSPVTAEMIRKIASQANIDGKEFGFSIRGLKLPIGVNEVYVGGYAAPANDFTKATSANVNVHTELAVANEKAVAERTNLANYFTDETGDLKGRLLGVGHVHHVSLGQPNWGFPSTLDYREGERFYSDPEVEGFPIIVVTKKPDGNMSYTAFLTHDDENGKMIHESIPILEGVGTGEEVVFRDFGVNASSKPPATLAA